MKYLRRSAFALAALVIWQGSVRRPTPPAQGDRFNGNFPTVADRATLRVAAFNIAGGVAPQDNVLDLNRTAKCLHGFDVIGMEEVHGSNLTEWRDQAQILGEILKMPWLYAASETRWWRDDFGNAALCSLPLIRWERIPLSTVLISSNRSLLRLTVRWHQRPLTILITHLDRHVDHLTELGACRQALLDAPLPAILMGDLNTESPDLTSDSLDPPLSALRSDPNVIDVVGISEGPNWHQKNLDWIFARGLRLVAGGLAPDDASDHPVAWAEFAEAAP